MLEFEAFLKTSDPERVIRIWEDNEFPEPGVELVSGRVDPFSAFANTLRRPIMKRAREEAGRHGLRIREPGRMFLRRQR